MKNFNGFIQWVCIGYFTRKDFQRLKKSEVDRLKLLLESCPEQNEHRYNFWISGDGKKVIPELTTKTAQRNQRIIDSLIIGYFNHKL